MPYIKAKKYSSKGSEIMEDMLYTVPEVAAILKTNVDYVYRLQKSGLLKFLKIGRWKCRKSTLQEFLAKYEGYDLSDPFNILPIEEQENGS